MTRQARRSLLAVALISAYGAVQAAPLPAAVLRSASTPQPDVVANATDGKLLLLQAGVFDPTTTRPVVVDGLALRETSSSNFVVVQFETGRVPDAAELERRGYQVIGYLPNNAFQLKLQGKQRAELAADPAVRYVGDWQPAYKLSPLLRPDAGNRAPGASHALDVYGYSGEDQGAFSARIAELSRGAEFFGGQVKLGRPFVRVRVNTGGLDSLLTALANEDQVAWLERFELPQLHNVDSVGPIQANMASGGNPPVNAPIWAKGILGTGQIVAVADSGLDRNEAWFNRYNGPGGLFLQVTDAVMTAPPIPGEVHPNRKVYGYFVMPGASAYDDNQVCTNSPTSFHGTHTSGTVAGDSGTAATSTAANYNTGDGMAPNAQILFQDLGNDSTGCLSGQGGRPMWEQAQAAGAYISSNSYGSGPGGGYTAGDIEADETLWLNEDFMLVFSAGNSGSGASTIGHPAHGKHPLTVGALNHGNATTVVGFSSRGPASDGRRKPDIQAPGVGIISAGGNDNDANPPANFDQANTASLSGTSMSAPTVAGASALARQYFTDGFYPSGAANAADRRKPLGAELKAVMLNGTAFIGTTPDNNFGWGRAWLDNNLFFTGDSRDMRSWAVRKENGLRTGQQHEYQVRVEAGQEFRATLVYYDPPGTPGAAKALVNDLDLEVTDGTLTWLGNVLTAGISTPGGSADVLNTVEQVRLTLPTAGTYTVRVKGRDVPGNQYRYSTRQGYALVVSGATVASTVTVGPTATASNVGGNVNVVATAVPNATSYQVYRAAGTCAAAAAADFQFAGSSATTTFVDTGTQGGFTYAYKVRGADTGGEGPLGACVEVTSNAACTLFPNFNPQSLLVSRPSGPGCGAKLSWASATTACPSGPNLRYNVYRSTDPFFVPSAATRIGSAQGSNYFDFTAQSLTTYYYAVRAEDSTTGNAGPNGGNETPEIARRSYTPTGEIPAPGTFSDGADSPSYMVLDPNWSITNTRAATGTLSYRNAAHGVNTYSADICSTITTPAITLQAGSPVLSYKARWNIELNWDGVVNEISTDGGNTWTDLAPDGGYPGTLSETQGNACNFPINTPAYTGTSSSQFVAKTRTLASFAGQTVRLRWRFSSDGGAEEEGFYLDDVQVTNASTPAMCSATENLLRDSFE